MFGKLMGYQKENSTVLLEYENSLGKLVMISDQIIRVYGKLTTVERISAAVEDLDSLLEHTEFSVEWEDGKVKVTTDSLVIYAADEFKLDIYDKEGNPLCLDYRKERTAKEAASEADKLLMEQEGHQTEEEKSYAFEIVKKKNGNEKFYGLGDKTGFLNKDHYSYEMWNTDNPAPQVDNFQRLYKSIPFFLVLGNAMPYGIFMDNTFRSCFNMGEESREYYYFAAEQGDLDYYFIAGKALPEVVEGYTRLTGRVKVPQLWTLGYHQSRWSYSTEEEVRELAKKFREYHIPCDVIHLDIDYMERFKVFTWGKENFSDPKKLLADLEKDGYKVVTIIDPGVKVEEGYEVYDEGVEHNYFALDTDGSIYVNEVWPGDAVYPDFGRKEVRDWWGGKQKHLLDMGVRGVWNDMNEPASFRGEIPDDIQFHQEERLTTHGEIHNVYGHYMAEATYQGLAKLDGRRPFVITRACYAGTQKYSTAWTGDNHSIWAHLQMAVPQLCNLGLSGMAFVGTDVGGFGSDVTPELLIRWVQIGCFSPLFRNHSAKGTKAQEPWQFGEEVMNIYRKYVELRYRLLPYFYDAFYETEKKGMPVMRPLVLQYEKDKNTWNLNDEFLAGSSLLVSPVVEQGAEKKLVYLPEGTWYDYWTGEALSGSAYLIKDAPLDVCPVFVKGGAVIPNYPPQEYMGEKQVEELILDVYEGNGSYMHYQEDGVSFAYENGVFNQYAFIQENGKLTIRLVHQGYQECYKGFEIRYKGTVKKVSFEGKELIVHL